MKYNYFFHLFTILQMGLIKNSFISFGIQTLNRTLIGLLLEVFL